MCVSHQGRTGKNEKMLRGKCSTGSRTEEQRCPRRTTELSVSVQKEGGNPGFNRIERKEKLLSFETAKGKKLKKEA